MSPTTRVMLEGAAVAGLGAAWFSLWSLDWWVFTLSLNVLLTLRRDR